MDRRKFLKTAALGAAAVCCDPATATQGSRKSTSSWVRISNVGLGGGKMMCFANRGPSQMQSTVFVSKTGHVAVVDGGHFDDGEFLYGKLKELGGRVDLWFITHPHSDHYGALDTILRKFGGRGIDIGLLVYNFADLEWIAHNEPKSSELMQKFLSLVNRHSGRIRVRKPAKGNVLALDGGVTFSKTFSPHNLDLSKYSNAYVTVTFFTEQPREIEVVCNGKRQVVNLIPHDPYRLPLIPVRLGPFPVPEDLTFTFSFPGLAPDHAGLAVDFHRDYGRTTYLGEVFPAEAVVQIELVETDTPPEPEPESGDAP